MWKGCVSRRWKAADWAGPWAPLRPGRAAPGPALARGLARGRGHLQGGLWGWPCLREGNRPAAPGWSLLLWKKRGRMAHGLRGHRWHGPQWPARPAPKAALRRRYREGLADIRAADRAVVGSGRVVASRSACERRHSGGEIGHAAAEFCKLRQGLFENGIVVRHSPTIGQPSPCRKFSVADDASRQRQAQPDDKVMAFSISRCASRPGGGCRASRRSSGSYCSGRSPSGRPARSASRRAPRHRRDGRPSRARRPARLAQMKKPPSLPGRPSSAR